MKPSPENRLQLPESLQVADRSQGRQQTARRMSLRQLVRMSDDVERQAGGDNVVDGPFAESGGAAWAISIYRMRRLRA